MADRSIHILQITDCHLYADETATLHGWRNWQALDAVLAHAHAHYPRIDAVLLSGDLVHDESPAGYQRLARRIQTLGTTNIYALPGNHDDPETMREHMPGVTTAGPATLGDWRLHLLNSRIPGSDGGQIGAAALSTLDEDLAAHPQTPALIAVHHPPMPVGTPWLDAMRLADGDALLALTNQHPNTRAVTCGHVHQHFDHVSGDQRLLCTPAVTRQFRPGSPVFAEDPTRSPGYRVLRLYPHGRLSTHVRRVSTARGTACG